MNMIQNAKDQVLDLTVSAYQKAAAEGLLPQDAAVTPSVEIPKDTANGDYTTTFCLAAAKTLKKNPRQVAQILMDHMDLSGSYFTSVEMAGPGFLNFRLGNKWFRDTVACVEQEGAAYGCNDTLKGRKIMVEFVSANPTGPMHMGNARGGVLGDTLASVLQKSGADVWREFYVNDAGNQIEKFAKSLEARYLQIIKGEDAVEFPEDGYHGDDIRERARAFYDREGEKYLDCDQKTRHDALARFGLDNNIPKMQRDLARYGITYDQWFFESSRHESGYVADSVQAQGAMDALGLDGEHRLDIVLMQLVKLVRDGEVVRMSKRTGKAISLTDLLDEIPVDACRYFFNAKPETQMEFDLGLAVREDSENPVYYVQYAHARICTLLKALEAEGYTVPAAGEVDFSLLSGEAEQALIKKIAAYSQVVRLAARDYDPSHINRYLTELAGDFHRFYTACRIKGEERPVLLARLKLADTARSVLKNAMTLIGCTAPEKM